MTKEVWYVGYVFVNNQFWEFYTGLDLKKGNKIEYYSS